MVTDHQLRRLALNRTTPQRYLPLGRVLDKTHQKLTANSDHKLQAARNLWSELISPELASYTFPLALRNGVLVVSAQTAAAKFTIEQIHGPALLEELRSSVGKSVRGIRCIVQAPPAD